MVKTLSVKNFKLLRDFSIESLGRVNLIVGRNNSGKSTVLEAIRILAANGAQSIINDIVESHDDNILAQNLGMEEDDTSIYEGLFSDRRFPEDASSIYIGTKNRSKFVEISRVYYQDAEEEVTDDRGNVVLSHKRTIVEPRELSKIFDASEYDQALQIVTHLNKDRPNYISFNERLYYARRRMKLFGGNVKTTPISYIPTQFLSMDLLASLWDKAVLTPYYENVKKFLRIISDDFEDLAFIKVSKSGRTRDIERTGIVKLRDQEKPVPLNGMGDGILRILQLVLGMFPAKNGFLLIDEFENGLHYTVQEEIWRLLFDLSIDLNIQIFATTHSWDCIEAFAKISKDFSDSAELFRLGSSVLKKNKGEVIATVFGQDKLINLTQSDVELR